MFGFDKEEYLKEKFSEDRGMAFSSGDDYEKLCNKIDRIKEDGLDLDDFDLEDVINCDED